MIELAIAAVVTLGTAFGAVPHVVQMIRSRRAGVKEEHIKEESQPSKPTPVEGFQALVESLQGEVARMSREQDLQRQRTDHIEQWNATLGDHVDVLENHIWERKPPPPPRRPKYTPFTTPKE